MHGATVKKSVGICAEKQEKCNGTRQRKLVSRVLETG